MQLAEKRVQQLVSLRHQLSSLELQTGELAQDLGGGASATSLAVLQDLEVISTRITDKLNSLITSWGV